MRVLVRAILVAGGAAALALVVRDGVATRVLPLVDAPTRLLAGAAARLPRAHASAHASPRVAAVTTSISTGEMLPIAPPAVPQGPVILPMMPNAAAKVPALPAASAATSAPSKQSNVITRAELEDAIATRLSGAQVSVVRDDGGHPLGLALHGVGVLSRFGIQSGDVLLRANGLPLRTGDEALAALGALQAAKRVTVSLRRGTTPYSVTVDLEP